MGAERVHDLGEEHYYTASSRYTVGMSCVGLIAVLAGQEKGRLLGRQMFLIDPDERF